MKRQIRGLRKLSPETAHIWIARDHYENAKAPYRLRLRAILMEARQLVDASARRQHIISRAMLHMLLPEYLGSQPWSLQCTQGQPPIVQPRHLRLSISLSHSSGMVALALARACLIGVDIESLPKPARLTAGVSRYLCLCCRASNSHISIWEAWCKKEALLKAIGIGLKGLEKNNPICLCRTKARLTHASSSEKWQVDTVRKTSNFILACATNNPRLRIQVREINLHPSYFQRAIHA